ncbi:MAG: hypothetical protein JWM11_2459 [Planctomycetaceae bacterium]|nr:hypothetical protein [Planctomycetaceae bacterium]
MYWQIAQVGFVAYRVRTGQNLLPFPRFLPKINSDRLSRHKTVAMMAVIRVTALRLTVGLYENREIPKATSS